MRLRGLNSVISCPLQDTQQDAEGEDCEEEQNDQEMPPESCHDDGSVGSANEEREFLSQSTLPFANELTTPLERAVALMHSQLPVSSTVKLVKNLQVLEASGSNLRHGRALFLST